jgi:hypothetical protein
MPLGMTLYPLHDQIEHVGLQSHQRDQIDAVLQLLPFTPDHEFLQWWYHLGPTQLPGPDIGYPNPGSRRQLAGGCYDGIPITTGKLIVDAARYPDPEQGSRALYIKYSVAVHLSPVSIVRIDTSKTFTATAATQDRIHSFINKLFRSTMRRSPGEEPVGEEA